MIHEKKKKKKEEKKNQFNCGREIGRLSDLCRLQQEKGGKEEVKVQNRSCKNPPWILQKISKKILLFLQFRNSTTFFSLLFSKPAKLFRFTKKGKRKDRKPRVE